MRYLVWIPTAAVCAMSFATLALHLSSPAEFAGSLTERAILLSLFIAVPAAVVASAKWVTLGSTKGSHLPLRHLFKARPRDPRLARVWLWGRLMLVFFAYVALALCALSIALAMYGQ